MAIIGAHMLLYSSEPEALRSILSTAFGLDSVDAGRGWLIFGLPPSEIAVHKLRSPLPAPLLSQIHLGRSVRLL